MSAESPAKNKDNAAKRKDAPEAKKKESHEKGENSARGRFRECL